MTIRTQTRRLAVAIALVLAVLVRTTAPSQAAVWRVEKTWYKTKATRASRAESLMGTGFYLDFACNQNTYLHPDKTRRWTLKLLHPQEGDPRLLVASRCFLLPSSGTASRQG